MLVPVMPVQAKGDARGGQHVKMCPAWHLGTPGMSRNTEPRELWGMDGRGERDGGDGGHGWRVRGWERKCGGRRKGEPGTLKSN